MAPDKAILPIAIKRSTIRIAVLTALIPTFTVNLCYLVSSLQGHVLVCVPYFEGCTSISSTGRHGISFWLFKAGMACSAALLALYWRRMSALIHAGSGRTAPTVLAVGTGGAVFLVLYTAFLGTDMDNKHAFQNIIEWNLSLLMQFYFLLTAAWLARRRRGHAA